MKHARVVRKTCGCELYPFCEHASNATVMPIFEEGDRVVILGNEQHGTVTKIRRDILDQVLVYVHLDDETFTDAIYGGIWTARTFELREEGEDGE